ncbi:TRAP transporter small permease [Hominifimenecus sp. rT4P-3]|uniref:TRAP transporter small permease n=1 Tax=Hominifimenecus sp. rT4P-3 TaxID=3242979 RepID=UPI003DA53E41
MQRYKKVLDVIDKVVIALTATVLAAMTVLMVYQVVLRYCFNSANSWTEELLRYLFVWVIMLGGSLAIRRNSHLKVDMFLNLLKPMARRVIQIVMYFAILGFLVVLCVLGIRLVLNTTNNLSAGIRVPMAVPYASIPIGAFLMILTTIEYLCDQFGELRKLRKGEPS